MQLGWGTLPPLAGVAIAMLVGGILGARRVAETVIAASIWKLPVSTIHVSTGGIFGIGLVRRSAHWRVLASGSNLHFAPGQYAPDTTSGQELIGHELAHVVQQRAGRVQVPQAKGGAPINADGALEAEADAAGARAARGEPAGIAGGGSSGGGAAAEGPIQRAVGFELEMLSWSSRYTDEDMGPIGKGVHIHEGAGFTMEGEDRDTGSTIEFVTEPLTSVGQVVSVVGTAAEIAEGLMGKKTQDKAVANGRPVEIDGTGDPGAGMHASPAVPLARIPALAEALDEAQITRGEQSMMPSLRLVDTKLHQVREQGGNPSEELRGLLTLTVYYLRRGRMTGRAQFPKELLPVMARTTFTKMLALVPEHTFFKRQENAGAWERLVLEAFAPEHDPKKVGEMPVFSQSFNTLPPTPDDDSKGLRHLQTTRSEWLSEMARPGGEDLLSRGVDERFEGMGGYGDSTDTLRMIDEVCEETVKNVAPILRSSMEKHKQPRPVKQVSERSRLLDDRDDLISSNDEPKQRGPAREAPLFELRQTGGGAEPPSKWVERATRVFELVEEVNEGVTYEPRKEEKKEKRRKRHDAPFVVDQRPQWLGRDMTVDEDEQQDPVQQDEESDDGGCCCCWPFSLFCRC